MKLITTKDTKKKLKKGVDTLADIVKVTLGGKGKNVIINNQFENVKIINDGVSIAREVELKDEVENTGATLAKQAAEKTNDEAGDGTTTTIVLLQAFLEQMSQVEVKDVRLFREQIENHIKMIIKKIDEEKRDLAADDIYRIAKNSSLDEEIAKTIEKIIKKVGKDGLISVEDGQKPGITSEVVNGIKINDGYMSPYMITDTETLKATIKDAAVLISKKRITSIKDILPVLEGLQSKGKNELVLIVEDISDDVLANLVVNKVKGVFNTCVVKTQSYEDISIVTGAEVITEEGGENYSVEALGYADKVEVTKYTTLVTGGKEDQEEIDKKIEELKKHRENADNDYDRTIASERIAKLQGGVSLIKIAGDNEQQTKEKKLKLEDALNAVKAAMEEGVIMGGGMALFKIARTDNPKNLAEELVNVVIIEPMLQVLANADEEVEALSKIATELTIKDPKNSKGYNVITRRWENFYESGIIDPAKVVKKALLNAFAMGTSILTAEAGVITEKEENKK